MKSIDVTMQQSVNRRTAVRNLLAFGALSVAALAGNDPAFAAATRRSTRRSDRRDESHDRDRHPRPPRIRHPRLNVYFDRTTSSVIVMGEKFSANARVTIQVDSGTPILDYSLPLLVSTARSVGIANYHGSFNQPVRIIPGGCTFTGRVEATDPATGLTASANFSGVVC